MNRSGRCQKINDRSDINYKIIFSSFLRNDIVNGEHPFAIVCGPLESTSSFEIIAFFATSDKSNNRTQAPGRFYPLLKKNYPFLANDSYVDTWSWYRGESKDIIGGYLKVAGQLSEEDALAILKSHEKGRKASKTTWNEIKFVANDHQWAKDKKD